MTDQINWIRFCMVRLRHRDSIWESERMEAWHHRQNIVHRFANGVAVEIKLKPDKKKWSGK